MQKIYPMFPQGFLQKLVVFDPTWTGGNQKGKYSKWIFQQARKMMKAEMNPDQIIQELQKQNLKKLLTDFIPVAKVKNLQIQNFISIKQMQDIVYGQESAKVPKNENAADKYRRLFLNNLKRGLKIIYDSENWCVAIPQTKQSSVAFGQDVTWCTTQNTSDYYRYYTEKGPLFINLDKRDGNLYQFHFQTDQFNDSDNNGIDMEELCTGQLQAFYKQYFNFDDSKESREKELKEFIEEAWTDRKKYGSIFYYFNFNQPAVRNGDIITGQINLGSQSWMENFQMVMNYLNDTWKYNDYAYEYASQVDISQLNKNLWNEMIAPLDISLKDIQQIRKEEFQDYNRIPENKVQKIYQLIQDNFGKTGIGFNSLYANMYMDKEWNEYFEQFINILKQCFPVNSSKNKYQCYDTQSKTLTISFSVTDLMTIISHVLDYFKDEWWKFVGNKKCRIIEEFQQLYNDSMDITNIFRAYYGDDEQLWTPYYDQRSWNDIYVHISGEDQNKFMEQNFTGFAQQIKEIMAQ